MMPAKHWQRNILENQESQMKCIWCSRNAAQCVRRMFRWAHVVRTLKNIHGRLHIRIPYYRCHDLLLITRTEIVVCILYSSSLRYDIRVCWNKHTSFFVFLFSLILFHSFLLLNSQKYISILFCVDLTWLWLYSLTDVLCVLNLFCFLFYFYVRHHITQPNIRYLQWFSFEKGIFSCLISTNENVVSVTLYARTQNFYHIIYTFPD